MGKTKTQQGRNHNSLETFNEFGNAFADTVKQEGKGVAKDFFSQLLGLKPGSSSESSHASPDKPLVIKDPVTGAIELFNAAHKKGEMKRHHAEKRAEAAIDHAGEVRTSGERASMHEMREVNQKLQDIMAELRRIVSSSKVLQMEFADVTVDQAPTQAGEYHINFFDWLLLTIRAARQKVEDSGAWLATAKNKSGKKGGYWGMFKKHGTSFAMSNERTVATQTG